MMVFLWLKLFFLRRLSEGRHVDADRSAQVNFMFLFLYDDPAQGLAERKFPHRLGLPDTLAITFDRFPFVLEVRAQHANRVAARFDRLRRQARPAAQVIYLFGNLYG